MNLILAALFTVFMGVALAGSYASHGLFCIGVFGMIATGAGVVAIEMDARKQEES